MSILESGQGKSPDGIKVPSTESAFDSKLLERLKDLKPKFFEIMTRMRRTVERDIGFGSLSKAHCVETIDMMFSLRDSEEGLVYPTPSQGYTHSLGYNYEEMSHEELQSSMPTDETLSEDDRKRIIVLPETTRPLPLVISIYQHPDFRGDSKDTLLIYAPDEVLEGLIAYNIASLFVFDRAYPWFITDFFESKGLLACQIKRAEGPKSSVFRFGSEGTHDVVASLFGYHDQILAKLQFMRRCASAYAENPNTDPSLLPGLVRLLQTTDMKIEAVKKYGTGVIIPS